MSDDPLDFHPKEMGFPVGDITDRQLVVSCFKEMESELSRLASLVELADEMERAAGYAMGLNTDADNRLIQIRRAYKALRGKDANG